MIIVYGMDCRNLISTYVIFISWEPGSQRNGHLVLWKMNGHKMDFAFRISWGGKKRSPLLYQTPNGFFVRVLYSVAAGLRRRDIHRGDL